MQVNIYINTRNIFNRWKGENVATLEVAEIIGMMDFVQEVNVYGVRVKSKIFPIVSEYKMKIVISYCSFSVLATACTNTCKDISGFSLAITGFLQCFEILVPEKCCI